MTLHPPTRHSIEFTQRLLLHSQTHLASTSHKGTLRAMMTPVDREILLQGGMAILNSYLPSLVVFSFSYGVLVPIAIAIAIATTFLSRRGETVARFQLAIALFGILIFTGYLTVQLAQTFIFLQFFTINSPSVLQRADMINARLANWDVAVNALPFIPPVFNDAFIIWRAWVVFEKRRWALYISVGMTTLTLVLTIVVLSIYSNTNFLVQSGEDNSKTLLLLSISPTIASFLTNFIATSFVGYRLWAHIKFLKKNLEGRSQRLFQVKHILSILVDTGFVYAVLQLCVIVLNVVSNDDIEDTRETVFRIFTNIYYSISFVYPAFTIALIRGQFSIAGIHESVVHISTISA